MFQFAGQGSGFISTWRYKVLLISLPFQLLRWIETIS